MKRVTKNFCTLFLSDALSRLLGFFVVVYIARVLTVEGLGIISYGYAFLTYALLFVNPGLTTIGAREIAKNTENHLVAEEILGLRIILAFIIYLLCVIGVLILPGSTDTKNIILIYMLSVFPFALLLEFAFQGREEMVYVAITRVLQNITYVAVLLIIVRTQEDILNVPISFFTGYAVTATFLLVVFYKKYHSIRIRFSIERWRMLLAMAIPVGIATILNQVSFNLPPLILGIFQTKEEVALFSVAFRTVMTLLIIERVFYFVFFPVLARHFKHARERLTYNFSFLTRSLLSITIPLTVGGLIMASGFIHTVYGTKFTFAIPVFRILLLYLLIAPINTMYGSGLIAIDQEKTFFKNITISALTNFTLVILFGILFGGTGAAAAFFLSEILCILLMHHSLRKHVRFSSIRYFIKPLLASGIMAIALFYMKPFHIALSIPTGIIIYFASLYLVKGVTGKDFQEIINALRKE